MERQRVHILISGHVQGVGFRFTASHVAKRLAVTGWVKNQHDGKVEIIAEGNQQQLAQLIEWAEQGPQYATVDSVITDYSTASDEFIDFLIID